MLGLLGFGDPGHRWTHPRDDGGCDGRWYGNNTLVRRCRRWDDVDDGLWCREREGDPLVVVANILVHHRRDDRGRDRWLPG